MWWSNADHRRMQKDNIKVIIKRKKLSEKTTTTAQVMTPGSDTVPELSHSLPTSATFSGMDRTRSASIDSEFDLEFDFSAPQIADFTAYNAQMHSSHSNYAPVYPEYAPYEVDVKTERQMFVDDNLMRRESTISTFSTFHPPPQDAMLQSFPADGEWNEDLCSDHHESMPEEVLNANFFDFAHGSPAAEERQSTIPPLSESDENLLNHFVASVLPTLFPILETNGHGNARSDMVLPALQSNECYRHCCLSISAQHFKNTTGAQGQDIDNDIMRHRYATISALCSALTADQNHMQILEATLGMIFFQCVVGKPNCTLPDIPWHQHFTAAISLVEKLQLQTLVTEPARQTYPTPFNMTLTSWIDILGGAIQGKAPTFAHTYREKHLSPVNTSLGLRELMGCEDRVMYLISEIACLEDLKRNGMDDVQLCQHVTSLGGQIGLTEPANPNDRESKIPFNASGVLSPKQLSKNVTAAFRLAARIYLCSLVPGFHPTQESCVGLVEKLRNALDFIPSGPDGFDRSLVWVYLIGGSVSTAGSGFRHSFEERVAGLEGFATFGSFGKLNVLLREVWGVVDNAGKTPGGGLRPYVSWRDVMVMKGWDFLLI